MQFTFCTIFKLNATVMNSSIAAIKVINPSAHQNWHLISIQTYVSKQRSTLSDMSNSMQSCSRAMSCISLSSPCPICSHSSNVSGSTSAMMPHYPIHSTPSHPASSRREMNRGSHWSSCCLIKSSPS